MSNFDLLQTPPPAELAQIETPESIDSLEELDENDSETLEVENEGTPLPEIPDELVAIADQDITQDTDPLKIEEIFKARYEILQHVGYTKEDIDQVIFMRANLFSGTEIKNKLLNLSNTIPGINIPHVLGHCPTVIISGEDHIQTFAQSLKTLVPNIRLTHVVNRFPSILTRSIDTLTVNTQNLEKMVPGLNLATVVNKCPDVICQPAAEVTKKIIALQESVPGINITKVIHNRPACLRNSAEFTQSKITNLRDAVPEINITDAINGFPSLLTRSTDTINNRIRLLTNSVPNIKLAKVIGAQPSILGLEPNTLTSKINNLLALMPGVNLSRLVNTLPTILSLDENSVKEKIDNLKELVPGLDITKTINTYSTILNFAPESVRTKVRNLNEIIEMTEWGYTLKTLIEHHPNILGINMQKLGVLLRITMRYPLTDPQLVAPERISQHLTVPLENFIIAISEIKPGDEVDLEKIAKRANNIRLDAAERKERAYNDETLSLVPQSIRKSYRRYREQVPEDIENAQKAQTRKLDSLREKRALPTTDSEIPQNITPQGANEVTD